MIAKDAGPVRIYWLPMLRNKCVKKLRHEERKKGQSHSSHANNRNRSGFRAYP